MPTYRPTTLGADQLDGVLSLDLDRGVGRDRPCAGELRRRLRPLRDSPASSPPRPGTGCRSSSCSPRTSTSAAGSPGCTSVRCLDAFEVRVGGGLPRVAERDRRDTLIELQRFDDSHGSHRLASFIWDRLEGGADGEVVNQLFEATGELGQNVVEHAGSPVGGFVAAQRYKAGAPEERIIVAVGDAGIGIRESLRPRYGDMTDRPGHHAGDPVECLPRSGTGPGPGPARGRRRGQGTRRGRLDPQRCGLEDDHARAGDHGRRVPSARYDCWRSVALPARRVTREEARSNSVDTHRPEAGLQP